jgi:hypothetical protein
VEGAVIETILQVGGLLLLWVGLLVFSAVVIRVTLDGYESAKKALGLWRQRRFMAWVRRD